MSSPAFLQWMRRGLAVGACVAACGAWAQNDGAAHMCGGIGSDESVTIRSQMKDHPLALLFARTDGAYLADVDVTIQDAATGAPALVFRARGPVCLVDLPSGAYTVQAVSDGVTKNQSVTIGSGSKTIDFRF